MGWYHYISVKNKKECNSLLTNLLNDKITNVTQCQIWSLRFRCFFLDKIREKLRGHSPSDSMEVDGSDPAGEIDTLVNDCKFKMKLHMADSAFKQVRKQLWKLLVLCCSMFTTNSPWNTNVVFRITFPWPPSCWRNFTEKPKQTEAGCCGGSTVLAATAINAARPRVLWIKSVPCWRLSHSWVSRENDCTTKNDIQL